MTAENFDQVKSQIIDSVRHKMDGQKAFFLEGDEKSGNSILAEALADAIQNDPDSPYKNVVVSHVNLYDYIQGGVGNTIFDNFNKQSGQIGKDTLQLVIMDHFDDIREPHSRREIRHTASEIAKKGIKVTGAAPDTLLVCVGKSDDDIGDHFRPHIQTLPMR